MILFIIHLSNEFLFSEEFASKVEIFEKGGLEPLINLLSSSDCDVQVGIISFDKNFGPSVIVITVEIYSALSSIATMNSSVSNNTRLVSLLDRI